MTAGEFIAQNAATLAIVFCIGAVLLFLFSRRLMAALRARRRAADAAETAEDIYRNFQRGRVQFLMTFIATVVIVFIAVMSHFE